MKKYIYTLVYLLFPILIFSCSDNDETTKNAAASRNIIRPIQDGEVQIGNQIWMTKNLNVSRYRNGDIIPQVTDPVQWKNLTTGAWCYYNNDPAKGNIYGKLYNWYAVKDIRGLAPNGYHIPANSEWGTLMVYLGGSNTAGGAMKSTTGWNSPNSFATNSSGFTAVPSAFREGESGIFYGIGNGCNLWSTTPNEFGGNVASFGVYYISGAATTNSTYKRAGMAIRCIKD